MPVTTKAVAVAAGAAAALAYYLRRKRRAEARRKLLATHTKIALLASERGAVVAMSPATSTVTFFKGSPRRVANKLRNKVAAIVEANPWLAARLDDDENGVMALFVPPELPELFAVRHDIAVERTPYASLVEALSPCLCGTSVEVRGTSKPLFQVSLVSCASNSYAVVVSANHSLVDGHGYYRIYNIVERPRRSAQAQQEGISLLEAEKAIEEENKSRPATTEGAIVTVEEEFEASIQEAKRRVELEKQQRRDAIEAKGKDEAAREAWLSKREDAVTSPRTKARRKLLRLLYKATRRQNQGYVICEWGCGQWCVIGREKTFHEKESCAKRIMPCLLGCGCRMREEQWLEIPDEEMACSRRPVHLAAAASSLDARHRREGPSTRAGRGDGVMAFDEPRNRQQIHEQDECPKRLIPCERRCGEFVAADKLEHHMQCLCIKRPFPPIRCRLGCGELFAGGAHEILKCEEDRLEHEQEMCPRRMVRCHVKGCAATVRAMDRPRHRRLHMLRGGIALHCVPGAYEYKVAMGLRQLKVQLWGGGGASGHLKGQQAGGGGGGAFVEALLNVIPGETLEIVVGAGGAKGQYGGTVQIVREDDPTKFETEEVCGVAKGGQPGGGDGHGGNECWACGGGGGYTMISRNGKGGRQVLFVAGGGGGGGARDGQPGSGLDGELPGTRIDKRNGRAGTQSEGGAAGDSGEAALCAFPSRPGSRWQGGAGAQFGGGGGGGVFGGGGGGTSPGIAGGGGGGSSFADTTVCRDVVILQGVDNFPGGMKHAPPKACGVGDWDFVGGVAGQGGGADIVECQAGKNGAVKIMKPGFYSEDASLLQARGQV